MNRNLSPEEFNLSHLPHGTVGARNQRTSDAWYEQTIGVAERLAGQADDVSAEVSGWLGGYDVMQLHDDSEAGEIRETQRQVRNLQSKASLLDDMASHEEIVAQSSQGYRRDSRRMWN